MGQIFGISGPAGTLKRVMHNPTTLFIVCFALLLITSGAPLHAAPPLGDQRVRGVNHAHVHDRGRGYGSERSAKTLTRLQQIGVNWVAITPFAYQSHVQDPNLRGFPGAPGQTGYFERTDPSMTDADIGKEVDAAHQRHIKVVLKPHVWSNDFWSGDQWHGAVTQNTLEAHKTWWRAYRAYILHYAKLADEHDVDAYCIGTELVKMTTAHEDEWRKLIDDVRVVYDGPLTYAAHWETELADIAFWDDLDAIGVTAYFPLKAPPNATAAQLVEAWSPHRERLAQLAARYEKPIVFLEAGYRPVLDTHREPWLHAGGQPAPNAQAKAYRAMFRAFADAPWWRGVFLWKTFTDPKHERDDGRLGFPFLDRPAERTVARWYGGE